MEKAQRIEMREEHIIKLLESAPLNSLSASELDVIRAHTAACAACRQAYEAAQVSALLLRERVAATVEPSPFFQTRVLAALRERQAANEGSALWRLWRATGALVSSMAATVAALAVLTFLAPGAAQPAPQEVASAFDPYAAEQVILAQEAPAADEMTYAQVLTTIYGLDE